MSRTKLEEKYGPGKWGDDNWDSTVHFATLRGEYISLEAVQAAFVFLLLAGLLILSLAVFLLRRSRRDALRPLPLIATLVAAFSMAAAMVNRFVSSMLNLHAATVTLYNYITLILANIFEQVSLCLLFFVFYAVIHLFRCRIVKADTKTFLVTKYVHWLFVGLFSALVIVDWSWFILCENSLVHDEYAYYTQSEKWAKIDCSRCILFWLAAWEIAGWVCYLGIMASRNLCGARIKMSMYFFIAASGFFLATNFLFFIWDILSYKRFLDNEGYADNGETSSGTSLSATASKGGQAVQEVLRFIFVLGSFFGLALCYWKFPGSESSSEEIEAGIKNRCIDRSGMKPREMDATQPMTTTTKKDKDLSEADYANVVLEADGVNAMNDKQNSTSMIPEIDGSKGIVEADDANVVLEADGIDFIEDKQKLTSVVGEYRPACQ